MASRRTGPTVEEAQMSGLKKAVSAAAEAKKDSDNKEEVVEGAGGDFEERMRRQMQVHRYKLIELVKPCAASWVPQLSGQSEGQGQLKM